MMSLVFVASLINLIATILSIVVLVWAVSSWILAPYHPVREALDRIVEPMLAPIRRILPATGQIDFSPMILIILLTLGARILSSIILSL